MDDEIIQKGFFVLQQLGHYAKLTGLITVVLALIGYRMIFGGRD